MTGAAGRDGYFPLMMAHLCAVKAAALSYLSENSVAWGPSVSSARSTSACTQVTDERGCIYYFPALVLDYWRCTLACTQPTSIALFQCTHSDSRFIRESPNIAGRGLISSIGHVHPWRPGRQSRCRLGCWRRRWRRWRRRCQMGQQRATLHHRHALHQQD